MPRLLPELLIVPIMGLLMSGLLPSRRPACQGGWRARLTMLLSGIVGVCSLLSTAVFFDRGAVEVIWFRGTAAFPVHLGIYFDAVTGIMGVLIGFLGVIIARFAERSLQGDAAWESFFRWMPFTLGAVLLLVVSGNLVMFTAAWMLASLGLHQLLTVYPERTWAVWAARKKFLISRLGDVFLLTAVALTFRCFGTSEYSLLFAAAKEMQQSAEPIPSGASFIGILLVLGAMTKSAQFPFHSWLPDTMETPTPVSALMHAGLINAGGFLVIRMSPVIALSPVALELLAVIGAATSLLGSLVMLTQTSLKRALAYSTIAQMGFMMLQCGVGAFAAALLHIVAHSAYKAHAFLSCGSVLESAAGAALPDHPTGASWGRGRSLILAACLSAGFVSIAFHLFGIGIVSKPGGPIFASILAIGLTQLLWPGLATGVGRVILRGLTTACGVAVAYAVTHVAIDRLLAGSSSAFPVTTSAAGIMLPAVITSGFLGLFILQSLPRRVAQRPWLAALHVHAMNGFYIDIPARRLTAAVYRQSAPVQ